MIKDKLSIHVLSKARSYVCCYIDVASLLWVEMSDSKHFSHRLKSSKKIHASCHYVVIAIVWPSWPFKVYFTKLRFINADDHLFKFKFTFCKIVPWTTTSSKHLGGRKLSNVTMIEYMTKNFGEWKETTSLWVVQKYFTLFYCTSTKITTFELFVAKASRSPLSIAIECGAVATYSQCHEPGLILRWQLTITSRKIPLTGSRERGRCTMCRRIFEL